MEEVLPNYALRHAQDPSSFKREKTQMLSDEKNSDTHT